MTILIYHIAKFENSVHNVIGTSDYVTMDSVSGFSSTISNTLMLVTVFKATPNYSDSTPSGGPDLFIYIIVAATGIVALLFVVVLLCMVLAYCFSLDRKR